MKQVFTTRGTQNLQAAQMLFNANFYDASVNRAYYAVFDATFVACLHFGITVAPEHEKVLSMFCKELIARRKIFPAHFGKMLYELQQKRIRADYGESSLSKHIAQASLTTAETIINTIFTKVVP